MSYLTNIIYNILKYNVNESYASEISKRVIQKVN